MSEILPGDGKPPRFIRSVADEILEASRVSPAGGLRILGDQLSQKGVLEAYNTKVKALKSQTFPKSDTLEDYGNQEHPILLEHKERKQRLEEHANTLLETVLGADEFSLVDIISSPKFKEDLTTTVRTILALKVGREVREDEVIGLLVDLLDLKNE